MERIITINGRLGRYDIPSFTYADNEPLTLRFKFKDLRVGRYRCAVVCGDEKKVEYLGENKRIEIPPEFIRNGGYNTVFVLLELRHPQSNAVIIPSKQEEGGFFIEPLVIEQFDTNLIAKGWMSKVEGELEALLRRCVMLEDKVAMFEDEGVPLLPDDNNEE